MLEPGTLIRFTKDIIEPTGTPELVFARDGDIGYVHAALAAGYLDPHDYEVWKTAGKHFLVSAPEIKEVTNE